MVTRLGSLVQSCCGEGDTADRYHWRVWGVLAVSGPHWVCPLSQRVCVPGLHFSGFRFLCRGAVQSRPWVLCTSQVHVLGYCTKAQTWLSLRFVPFPGPSSSGDQVLGEHSQPQLEGASYHLPGPSHSVSWVLNGSAISGVPCVSSGTLISGCDPPD